MKIVDVVCAPGKTGFYFDDQRAIKKGAVQDGFFYNGTPVTQGFSMCARPGKPFPCSWFWRTDKLPGGTAPQCNTAAAGAGIPFFWPGILSL